MIPGMLPKICHLAAYKNEGLESNLAIPDARHWARAQAKHEVPGGKSTAT
jgi:hypothetical protein